MVSKTKSILQLIVATLLLPLIVACGEGNNPAPQPTPDPTPQPTPTPTPQPVDPLAGKLYAVDLKGQDQGVITLTIHFLHDGLASFEYQLLGDISFPSTPLLTYYTLDQEAQKITFDQQAVDKQFGNKLLSAVRSEDGSTLTVSFQTQDNASEDYTAHLVDINPFWGKQYKSLQTDQLSSDIHLLFPTEKCAIFLTKSPTQDNVIYSYSVCGYKAESGALIVSAFSPLFGMAQPTDNPLKLSMSMGDGLTSEYQFAPISPEGILHTLWIDPSLITDESYGLTGFYFLDESTVLQLGTSQDSSAEILVITPQYSYQRVGDKVTIHHPDGDLVFTIDAQQQTATAGDRKIFRL